MSRLMTSAESDALLEDVRLSWAWSGYYWHPLHPATRTDVLAFVSSLLEREFPEAKLRGLLCDLGIGSIYWHREFDPTEEATIESLPVLYGGSEMFIVDDSRSWIIYSSHEDTITFGGDRLISAIKNAVPGWARAQGGWAETTPTSIAP
jgi:hypothetical protein